MERDNIQKGAFQIARKIFESDFWLKKPSAWKVIWIYILGKVNHKKQGGFERGEGFFNFAEERRYIGSDIKYQSIMKFLKYAEIGEMIGKTKSTRGIVIKVLKYDKYQTLDNYISNTKGETDGEVLARQRRDRGETINKNDKNDKNEKKDSTPSKIMINAIFNWQERNDNFKSMVNNLVSNGIKEQTALKELDKFFNYWTEKNKTGTKQRWEMQKTFELKRRLITWFNNSNKFNK